MPPSRASSRTMSASPGTSSRRCRAAPIIWSGFPRREPRHGFADVAAGLGGIAPASHLHPLAAFQVLVVLEEVLDLLARDLRQVGVFEHALIAARHPRTRHCHDLLVATGFVLHLQHAYRAHGNH